MKPFVPLLLCTIWGTGLLYGSEDPLHRERVREGVEACYRLDHARAFEIFNQLKKDYPDSPVGYGMTALTAWNEFLFKVRHLAVFQYGMPTYFDETQLPEEMFLKEHQRFEDANEALLEVCNRLIEKNPRNALAHYFKGVYYENLSMQALMLYKERTQSGKLAKTAGKIHEEAQKLDAGLVDANTSMAVVEYAVGSLNFFLRILAKGIYGFPSDKEGAIKRLQEVADRGIFRYSDAILVMGYLETWKGDPKRAVALFGRLRETYPDNFLLDICLAVAYENAAEDSKSAIRVYQDLLQDLPRKASGIYPGEIHYRIGQDYIKLKDYSLALEEFKKALSTKRGESETEPLAHYNMAQIYEERGEKSQARDSYRRVAEYSGPTALIEEQVKRAKKKIK